MITKNFIYHRQKNFRNAVLELKKTVNKFLTGRIYFLDNDFPDKPVSL